MLAHCLPTLAAGSRLFVTIVCQKRPDEVKGRRSRATANRVPVAGEVQLPSAAPRGTFRMKVDEPDRLLWRAAARACDARHRDGDVCG